MTSEEQKEKYREWLFGLAKKGSKAYFQAKVKVFEGKRNDGTNYVKAYMGDNDYVIFTPMEWFKMFQTSLTILHVKQLNQARPPKGRGILEQIKRDIPINKIIKIKQQ